MRKYILVSVILFVGLLTAAEARAATYNIPCSGGADIYSTAQGDIDSASNGDIISIGSGSCSLSKSLIWIDKNITVMGAGAGQTNIAFSTNATACGSDFGGADAFCIKMTCASNSCTPGTSSAGLAVNKVSWRISGMTLTGTPGNSDIIIELNGGNAVNSTPIQGWRIDHVNIDTSAAQTGGLRSIFAVGIVWGLIDHFNCNIYGGFCLEQRAYLESEYGQGYCTANYSGTQQDYQAWEGNASWLLPLHLGSDEAIYMEDSTITLNASAANPFVNDMYAGAAFVGRHNTINNATYYGHASDGVLGRGGVRKFEYYNNVWTGAEVGGEAIGTQEGGTGVIFNNTIPGSYTPFLVADYRAYNANNTGSYYGNCQPNFNACTNNTGHGTYDAFIETSGWPCLDQPGRGSGVALGTTQPSIPILMWNNGASSGCSSGGSCDNTQNVISLNTASFAGTYKPQYQAYPLSMYVKTTAHSNGDKDYCVGTTMPTTCGTYTNNYVPYVYPHPCQTNWPACSGGPTPTPTPQPDTTPPSAPTGVKVN